MGRPFWDLNGLPPTSSPTMPELLRSLRKITPSLPDELAKAEEERKKGRVGAEPREPTHVEDTLRKSRRERNWFRMGRKSFVEARCSTEHHEGHTWYQMTKKEPCYKKHNRRNHAWHLIVRVAALMLLQPYPYHERCLLVRW